MQREGARAGDLRLPVSARRGAWLRTWPGDLRGARLRVRVRRGPHRLARVAVGAAARVLVRRALRRARIGARVRARLRPPGAPGLAAAALGAADVTLTDCLPRLLATVRESAQATAAANGGRAPAVSVLDWDVEALPDAAAAAEAYSTEQGVRSAQRRDDDDSGGGCAARRRRPLRRAARDRRHLLARARGAAPRRRRAPPRARRPPLRDGARALRGRRAHLFGVDCSASAPTCDSRASPPTPVRRRDGRAARRAARRRGARRGAVRGGDGAAGGGGVRGGGDRQVAQALEDRVFTPPPKSRRHSATAATPFLMRAPRRLHDA